MSMQIVVDPSLQQPWTSQILKKGTPNKKPVEPIVEKKDDLELSSDDEVEIA